MSNKLVRPDVLAQGQLKMIGRVDWFTAVDISKDCAAPIFPPCMTQNKEGTTVPNVRDFFSRQHGVTSHKNRLF